MAVYSIPNSISIALALGVQEYRAHCLATICLIDCQTVASQCAIAQCLKGPLLNQVYKIIRKCIHFQELYLK